MNRLISFWKIGNLQTKSIIMMLWFVCLVGCVHAPAPYRPSSWLSSPIDLKSIADNPDQPLLQVIIVYGPAWDHHSALRLVYPGRPVLFWDPGGSYGTTLPGDVRSKDLIMVNPPDLETYLQHIWHFSSVEVEVFEWDLKPEDARELYNVLLNGTDRNHPAGRFTTTTLGMFCTVSVSDFLHRFATKTDDRAEIFLLPTRSGPGAVYSVTQTCPGISSRQTDHVYPSSIHLG